MGFFDYITGGNVKVAAKFTAILYREGLNIYGNDELAFRYTYIFRNNTIRRYADNQRDLMVSELFQRGEIRNCTDITIAHLNTGAAPKSVHISETYKDFNEKVINYLRKFGIPEKYITGDNKKTISHIADYLYLIDQIIKPEMYDDLIKK
ncbi:hypothetical protein [Xenorhabdus sp. KJ12.1]|uniref:hypothetical protein n=1 Tax=Xenorhabdus sp. KJ12.1 TaxID=1851571 RepID=UPI000C04BA63|nr:hypothetical protein [Xenorhabdus sp. KJ12.1]PHM72274.1 hypothetical protein Xekj_00552 [Xenorhabdus sp. KJ12.1]